MEFGLPHAAASPAFGKVLIALFLCFMLTPPVLAVSSSNVHGLGTEEPLSNVSRTMLHQDIDAFFGRRADRVELYADWTYGWATSYANSYFTAARVLSSIWKDPTGWPENVVSAVRAQQLSSVTKHVLQPERDAAGLEALVERHAGSRLFINEMQLLSENCVGASAPTCRDKLAPKLAAVSAAISAEQREPAVRGASTAAFAALLGAKPSENVDVFHLMRPLTSRVTLLVLRLTELASLVLVISAALRRIYLPNTAVTRFAVALVVAWSLDYALLTVERGWQQEDFKAQVVAGLESQEGAVTAAVSARLDAIEASFMTAAAQHVQGSR
jgi:hypothetical protein